MAGSAALLVGARALQGFGAALIPPAVLSILAVTFPEGAESNRALGTFGAVAGIFFGGWVALGVLIVLAIGAAFYVKGEPKPPAKPVRSRAAW